MGASESSHRAATLSAGLAAAGVAGGPAAVLVAAAAPALLKAGELLTDAKPGVKDAAESFHLCQPTSSDTSKPDVFFVHVEVVDWTRQHLQKALEGYGEKQDVHFRGSDAEFQRSLATAWSRGPLCHDVNRALYMVDAQAIKKLAPYIKLFREAFRTANKGHGGSLKPFDGHLFRHMNLSDGEINKYKCDAVVVWPTFSSCTYDEEWLAKAIISANAQFEIKSYGATEASECEHGEEFYVPCLIQEHVLPHYTYQKEVVIPPYCQFRVVNVRRADGLFRSKTRVFMETTQFPSVWKRIEEGDVEGFESWANENKELVCMSGNDVSLVNEIAKAAASSAVPAMAPASAPRKSKPHADGTDVSDVRSGKIPSQKDSPHGDASFLARSAAMLDVCASAGAPVNEPDPSTGANPVHTLAKAIAATRASAPSSACGAAKPVEDELIDMVGKLARHGANLTIPVGGKTAAELIPDVAVHLKHAELRPNKWEYWVDDGVDGKADGWYDYEPAAWAVVDKAYKGWLHDGSLPGLRVKSGHFTYSVDFTRMTQQNTQTYKKTVRRIRRRVEVDGKEM